MTERRAVSGRRALALRPTPSQTIGPFFGMAIPRAGEEYAVPAETPGGLWLRGTVIDGAGEPVRDALIETWQPSPGSRATRGAASAEASPRAVGRSATDGAGRYAIFTVKPEPLPVDGRPQAPHLDVIVFARGLLRHVVTRIYFGDESEANADDPVLASIDDLADRATLVAEPADDGYWFDIRLQGERETVFFQP